MKLLFDGCSRSELAVTPVNWNTQKASIKKPWKIHYRFYDPAFKDDPLNKGKKQVAIRRMNSFHTLAERQAITKELIKLEEETIDLRGYNPITGKFMAPAVHLPVGTAGTQDDDLTPKTPFISALRKVIDKLDVVKTTKEDITSAIKYLEQSAILLQKNLAPVGEIRRKDIRLILDNCKNITIIKDGKLTKKVWTNNQFNHYRSYLSMLYLQLVEFEVVDYNPVKGIGKKTSETKMREVLTDEQRQMVDRHLKEKAPPFHRYIHIFFHSGARRTELLQVRGKDVDLQGQRYKILIKKGQEWREIWKTIKDVALPFWIEAMENCRPEDYIFSVGLLPGEKPIRPEQVTRRWRRHVKNELGIDADLYSLKHLHTTEIRDIIGEEDESASIAAEHNSHTSTAMVVNIYDVKSEARKHNKVKGLQNKFA